MTEPERAAREFLLADRRETVRTLLQCAKRVAEGWDDGSTDGPDSTDAPDPTGGRNSTTDRDSVVRPLSRELRKTGLLERLPDLLSETVTAAGFSLQARPVPAPPYVAVTSRGPVLRATLPAGRLVVSFRLFDVVRDENATREDGIRVRYVLGARDPEKVVSVELR
ncbi:hypothetical protein ZOD2009_03832 [Haladaptatus paucihalophilus DX253]|uniref:DUF7988 domain-containing protein n=1 Tax=Haladaptatus paucihalophilus DX253 TaxID=797209 RepID=E7QPQ8_HALPU|nr:hypothetical protein [Haladaptatus paucihalophilus]EFW93511.1 hypothetical protein ZOD2009_03832 [Haladaptatus paucihalophilus DX253]SHL21081.1 hypothetical protein SAMN05444342_3280 [Haladaptatus paucihalophilus DX253]